MHDNPKAQITLRDGDSSPILSGSAADLVARGRKELADLARRAQTLLQTRKRAEQGDAAAQYELSLKMAEDSEAASESLMWLGRAVDQGYAKAQYILGRMWLSAPFGESETAESEAAVWFRKAAEQGYAHAQYALGKALEEGRGLPQDSVEASEWFRRAANQGVFGLDGWQP